MADGSILLHCYIALPKGLRLPEAIARVTDAAALAPIDARSEPRADPVAKAFATTFDLPDKIRPAHFLAGLADSGVHGVVAIATLSNGKMVKLWVHKQEFELSRDALAHVVKTKLEGGEVEADLDLLAKTFGGGRMELLLPDMRDRGVALLTLDLDPDIRRHLEDRLVFLAALNSERPTKARKKGLGKRLILASVLIAAAVYLAAPAPVYVSNFAITRATQAQVVALPFAAFLEDVAIRAGQMAQPGQVLIRLRSPVIEDGLAEQAIQRQLEEINAQEAIETGRVAEFQLAEKRKELASIREAQLAARASILTITADQAARVVSVQSQADKGMFLPEGTPVITLQTSEGFDVTIDVNPTDAALLAVGQTGNVQFRGVSTTLYPITVLSTPVQVEDPNSPTPVLQVKARIAAADQSDLVTGLNGFAKIDTGRAPRIVGLTRPLRDYIRVSLWKYLGFTF
jgi:hypothetical protein